MALVGALRSIACQAVYFLANVGNVGVSRNMNRRLFALIVECSAELRHAGRWIAVRLSGWQLGLRAIASDRYIEPEVCWWELFVKTAELKDFLAPRGAVPGEHRVELPHGFGTRGNLA